MKEAKEVLKDVANTGKNVVKETFADIKEAIKTSAKTLGGR